MVRVDSSKQGILSTITVKIMNDLGEAFLRLLMQVRNSDTSSKNRVIGVFRRQIRSGLRGQVLQRPERLGTHSFQDQTTYI